MRQRLIQEIYTLATTVLDEPYTYENGRAVNNYERSYDGWLSIREAIIKSKNIIAVKTLTDLTPNLGYEYLDVLESRRWMRKMIFISHWRWEAFIMVLLIWS